MRRPLDTLLRLTLALLRLGLLCLRNALGLLRLAFALLRRSLHTRCGLFVLALLGRRLTLRRSLTSWWRLLLGRGLLLLLMFGGASIFPAIAFAAALVTAIGEGRTEGRKK